MLRRTLPVLTTLLASGAISMGTAWSAGAGALAPWLAAATPEGAVANADTVTVALFLPLRNRTALQQLIAEQSDPDSASYGQYLSPAQFRARYAPLPEDVAKVEMALQKMGFVIGTVPESGLYVEATGTASMLRQSFGVSQHWYAFRGRLLRATASAPTLPASIAGLVVAVAGLDDGQKLRTPEFRRLGQDRITSASFPALKNALPNAAPPIADSIPSPYCSSYYGDHVATLSSAPGPYPRTEPWLVCGYTPQQVRTAYGVDRTPYSGLLTTVGIVDTYASPTIEYDVNRYSAFYGLPKLDRFNYRQIVPAGLTDVPATDPCGPQGWYEEETLDHEAVHSMAPNAAIVYAGNTCTDPVNTALTTLIDRRAADIITNSYSYGGEDVSSDQLAAEEQLFEQAAAEGISVLFSSGDDGDLIASNGVASGTWNATSPYVTAVGGTSLALRNRSGAKDEWGWGNARAFLADATVVSESEVTTTGLAAALAFYAGSGGGPSLVWAEPAYQRGIVPTADTDTTTYETASGTLATEAIGARDRVTPDISLVADPYTGFSIGETYTTSGSAVTDTGCTPINATEEYCLGSIGGTSLSSPLLAGVLADVDEARLLHLRPPVGFVNPALYRLAVGRPGSTNAPIVDVQAPASPNAVLRGYLGTPSEIRLVTMNSTIAANGTTVLEGRDTSYTTTKGYDEVTGLGTPYVPALIDALVGRR